MSIDALNYCAKCHHKFSGYVASQYCQSCSTRATEMIGDDRTQVLLTALRTQIDALDRSNGTLQNALDTSDKLIEQARTRAEQAERDLAKHRAATALLERKVEAFRHAMSSAGKNFLLALEDAHRNHWDPDFTGSRSPWQPIETAPKDGTSIQIRHWDILPLNAFWADGKWVLLEYQYPSHANPTHWAPIEPREQS